MELRSILLVGCGNMAGAMLDGWLAAGLDPARFTAVDPARTNFPAGIRGLAELPPGEHFDAILLGVKPQSLDAVAPLIAPLTDGGTMIFSLLAGVRLAELRRRFGDARAMVRVMPNLAAALGKSPVGLAESGLGASELEGVAALFEPLGAPEWIDEELFDAVTALVGSGPAFVYRFIDELAAAGAEIGLPRDLADRLALAMVEGAAALAASTPHPPAELVRRVASPGGTTEAGLAALDEGRALAVLLERTLRAARDRGAELAERAGAPK